MKNKVITLTTAEQFIRWWPFLRTGFDFLVEKAKWKKTVDEYFRALLYIVYVGDGRGCLLILVNGGGQPLGFIALADISTPLAPSTATIYALYSNSMCQTSFTELAAEAEQWARSLNLKNLTFPSYRFSQAAVRWLTSKLGFEKNHILFGKSV